MREDRFVNKMSNNLLSAQLKEVKRTACAAPSSGIWHFCGTRPSAKYDGCHKTLNTQAFVTA